jgi:hypothetical protein
MIWAEPVAGAILNDQQIEGLSDQQIEKSFRCACAARTDTHFCESCWEKWASSMSAMLPGEVAESLLLASRHRWEFLREQHKAHGGDPFRAFRRAGR